MNRLFEVWAPRAGTVDLHVGDEIIAMQKHDDGHFRVTVARTDTLDYRFAVDGGPAVPDPRTRWQPAGVHGPSRTLASTPFAWTDEDFRPVALGDAVIYELHVGSFSPEGTFAGVVEKLEHLVGLGVTHVELMPVVEFPGERGWGYDGVDLFAPHHAYGGADGLRRLVNACHARGLAVILDVVYNHLGPSGNYLAQFAPYFTERHRTPWGAAVNLDDADSDGVRRFFIDNALHWLRDYHIDGLRLDAVHALFDASAVHFLEQLGDEVERLSERLGRRLCVIAESDLNDPRLVRGRECGGHGLDGMWCDDFHHALHTVLTGERDGYYEDFGRLSDLARSLTRGMVYDGRYSRHRRRRHGRPLGQVSGRKLVSFVQNHDQVGNRARGERLSQLAGVDAAKLAATLLLTSPFVPLLFQGEEWVASAPFPYFTHHGEPELADAVRRGRREEFAAFGWRPEDIPDPQAAETAASAKLDWGEAGRGRHAEVLSVYRELIALRRRADGLRDGCFADVTVAFDEEARWLRVERAGFVVVANCGPATRALALPRESLVLRLATDGATRCEAGSGVATVVLPALAAAVFERGR